MSTEFTREDLEIQFIDYLKYKYPQKQDFVAYIAETYLQNGYEVRDYWSKLPRDIIELVLEHLDHRETVRFVSTCSKLYSLLNDQAYWFRRLKRDFYRQPFVGNAVALVRTRVRGKKRNKAVRLRWFDIYSFKNYFSNNSYQYKSLMRFLTDRLNHQVVGLPHNMGQHDSRQSICTWPAIIVKVACLGRNECYDIVEVGNKLFERLQKYPELLQKLPHSVASIFPKLNAVYSYDSWAGDTAWDELFRALQDMRLDYIWKNISWRDVDLTKNPTMCQHWMNKASNFRYLDFEQKVSQYVPPK